MSINAKGEYSPVLKKKIRREYSPMIAMILSTKENILEWRWFIQNKNMKQMIFRTIVEDDWREGRIFTRAKKDQRRIFSNDRYEPSAKREYSRMAVIGDVVIASKPCKNLKIRKSDFWHDRRVSSVYKNTVFYVLSYVKIIYLVTPRQVLSKFHWTGDDARHHAK